MTIHGIATNRDTSFRFEMGRELVAKEIKVYPGL
jgi:hypothetical protein